MMFRLMALVLVWMSCQFFDIGKIDERINLKGKNMKFCVFIC